MSVLLVYVAEHHMLRLELAISDAGVAVERARNGFHALKRLVEMRPALVVCAAALEDMTVSEFHRAVRARAELADATFVYVSNGEAPFVPGRLDRLAAEGEDAAELWRRLAALVAPPEPASRDTQESEDLLSLSDAPQEGDPERADADGADDADADGADDADDPLDLDAHLDAAPEDAQVDIEEAPAPPPPRRAAMSGSFGLIGVFELLTSLHGARKTGRLRLHLGFASAELFLKAGNVVHARTSEASGEAVAREVILAVDGLPGATFVFEPLDDDELRALPTTIAAPTDKLLMQLAVLLDHHRAGRQP